MHSIFKIGISRNMKCAYMVGFLKYSHICNYKCDHACNQDNQSTVQLFQHTYDISIGEGLYVCFQS